ncbi:hypothetical protein GMDG_08734, partial [Pseudogymnoascus destructans 20631-21]
IPSNQESRRQKEFICPYTSRATPEPKRNRPKCKQHTAVSEIFSVITERSVNHWLKISKYLFENPFSTFFCLLRKVTL